MCVTCYTSCPQPQQQKASKKRPQIGNLEIQKYRKIPEIGFQVFQVQNTLAREEYRSSALPQHAVAVAVLDPVAEALSLAPDFATGALAVADWHGRACSSSQDDTSCAIFEASGQQQKQGGVL